jgi:YD repeat-containing protein
VSTFLAFLLALASSFTSTEAPAHAHARPKTRGTLTEVHFFKADDLTRAIATYKPAVESINSPHHGVFRRDRFGPRDLAKAERLRAGIGDARVLREGDEVTMFAINHATGYSGMTTVKVPAYDDPAARITDVLEIVGDIKLFPPEIELTVERQLKAAGVAAPTAPSKIRGGGAATTGDEWLKIGSRWRVRLAPPRHDDYVDGGSTARGPGSPIRASWGEGRTTADLLGADAGQLETDTSDAGFIDGGPAVQQGVTALVDEGKRAAPLERLCSELDENATPREYLDCLNDETTLTDVPAGIPPIAGRIVHLSGAASTDQLFHIEGGAHEQALHVARKTTTSTTLPIQTGLHLLHVVGRPLSGNADVDGDGELSQSEREAGSDCSDVTNADGSTSRRCTARIMASDEVLLQGAPDFRDDVTMRGLPKQAVAVKAVYDARLQPEASGPTRKVASYDTTREHRFRVLSVEDARVEAGNADSSRELEQDETGPRAEDGDTWLGLFTNVVDVGARELDARGLDTPGEFEVRLGGDSVGIDCSLTVSENGTDKRALEGMCDGQSIDEVISALDIVYIELFESGNSDNVLYRYNLYGTRQRLDHAAVNSGWNGRKSVEAKALATPHKRPEKAAVSEPNVSFFYLDPDDIERGIIKICQQPDCTGPNDPLKDLDVKSYSPEAGYDLLDRVSSKQKLPLVDGPAELTGTRWFKLVLPPEMTKMDGVDDTSGIPYFVNYEALEPIEQSSQLKFKTPGGRSESIGMMSAGHTVVANVDVADGRLLRSYPDIVLPEKSTSRSFVRFYNNQFNGLTPLGTGWTHNLDAYVLEEVPGRYVVLFDGQARVFQECALAVNGDEPDTRAITSVTSCVTDKVHGGLLTIKGTSDDGGNSWKDFSAELSTEDGVVVHFDRLSERHKTLARRRYFATWVDDGLKEKLWFKYDGDLVSEVTRAPPPGAAGSPAPKPTGLTFTLRYEDIVDGPRNAARVVEAQELGTQRLIGVTAKLPNNTIVAEVKFDHDVTKALDPADTTPDSVGPQCGAIAAAVGEKDHMNLTRACRFTRATTASATRRGDLRWEYEYDAPRGKGLQWNVSANELKTEKMKLPLVADTATSSSQVYEASYTRNSNLKYKHPYDQVNGVEAIHGATVQGETYAFAYDGTNRDITFPSGTKKTSILNSFGHVDVLETPCGVVRTSSESDVDTGRALPTSTKDEQGFQTAPKFDARHRLDEVRLTDRPTTDMKPVAGLTVGLKTTVLERDERTGTPLRVRVPQQDGDGYVEMTSTLDARGFVVGGSVIGAGTDGKLEWNQPIDDNGMPTGIGRTTAGHAVEHLTFDPEWGLPASVRRTCDACLTQVSDGFGNTATVTRSITETYEYDSLGRVIQQSDNVSGRLNQWRYDAAGRVVFESSTGDETDSEVHFGDSQTETTYKQAGSTLTTTALLHRREKKLGDAIVDEVFPTVIVSDGGLTKTITDSVGLVSTYTYDGDDKCRLSKIRSVGGGKTTEVRFVASTTPGAVKQQQVYSIAASPSVGTSLLSVDDFDEQGRVVQRIAESDEGSELLTYSAGGLLTKRSYGDGHVIEHEYDSLGRLTAMVSAGASATEKRALFTRFSDFKQGTLPGKMTTKQKGEETFIYDIFGAVVLSEQSVKSLKLRNWSSELHASVDAVRIKRTRLSDYTYGATTTIDEYNAVQSPSVGTMQRWLTRDVSAEGRVLSEHDHKDDTKITYEYERDSRGMIAKTTTTIADASGGIVEKFVETQSAGFSQMERVSSAESAQPADVLEIQSFYNGGKLRRRELPNEFYQEFFRSYDGAQARIIVRQPTQRPADVTTTIRSFDDAGRVLVEQRTDGLDAGAAPGVRVETVFVDGNDRTTFTRRVEEPIGTLSKVVSGTMDGNGRIVVEESAPLTLYHEYDAAGMLRAAQTPTGIAKSYDNGLPFLLDNADGGKTIVGYFDGVISGEEVLVVPAAVWTQRATRCNYSTDPVTDLDPDAIARLIVAGRVGNSNAALRQMTSELLVNGKPRCEVLGLTKVAGQESAAFLEGARRGLLEAEMFVAGMLIPGPEDLVISYGLRKLGELAARRAAMRAGLGVADDALDAAKAAVCRIGATPCFVAGTEVRTDHGLVPIEEIEVGDLVWAGDEVTGDEALRPVVQVFINEGSAILDLEVVDAAGASEVLGTTGEHPFYVEGRGFVEAHRLELGDRVIATDDRVLTIASTTWRATTDTVFNLEVEDFHTYFVGESGAWVHNNSGCGPSLLAKTRALKQAGFTRAERRGFLNRFGSHDLPDDPNLLPFIRDLERRGVAVQNFNIKIGAEPLGEIDVITKHALIQFKGGTSSAYDIIKQLDDTTLPFVSRPVVAFVSATHRAGNTVVAKVARRGYLITNDIDVLVGAIR